MGSAIRTPRICARPKTKRVVGRRCRISASTLTRLTKEKPQSPFSMEVNQRTYRTSSGSSRPYCARKFMRTSAGTLGLVASSSKGSPGARARMVNRTTLIPIRTGTVSRRRRKKYLDMSLGRRPGPGPGQSLTLPLAVPVGEVPEVGVPARDVGALELAGHGGDHAAPQHGNDHHVLDDHVVHPDEEGSALDRIQLR